MTKDIKKETQIEMKPLDTDYRGVDNEDGPENSRRVESGSDLERKCSKRSNSPEKQATTRKRLDSEGKKQCHLNRFVIIDHSSRYE